MCYLNSILYVHTTLQIIKVVFSWGSNRLQLYSWENWCLGKTLAQCNSVCVCSEVSPTDFDGTYSGTCNKDCSPVQLLWNWKLPGLSEHTMNMSKIPAPACPTHQTYSVCLKWQMWYSGRFSQAVTSLITGRISPQYSTCCFNQIL